MDHEVYKAIVLSILVVASVSCYYMEMQKSRLNIDDGTRMSFGFSFLFVICLILM